MENQGYDIFDEDIAYGENINFDSERTLLSEIIELRKDIKRLNEIITNHILISETKENIPPIIEEPRENPLSQTELLRQFLPNIPPPRGGLIDQNRGVRVEIPRIGGLIDQRGVRIEPPRRGVPTFLRRDN